MEPRLDLPLGNDDVARQRALKSTAERVTLEQCDRCYAAQIVRDIVPVDNVNRCSSVFRQSRTISRSNESLEVTEVPTDIECSGYA